MTASTYALLVEDVAQVRDLVSKEVALLHRQLQPGVSVGGKDGADVADVVLHLRAVDDAVVEESDGDGVRDVFEHEVDESAVGRRSVGDFEAQPLLLE